MGKGDERKKTPRPKKNLERNSIALDLIRSGSRKQRELKVRNKVGALYESKETARDSLKAHIGLSIEDNNEFKRRLNELYRERRTRTGQVPRIGVSDKHVWKTKEENPDLEPFELMQKSCLSG